MRRHFKINKFFLLLQMVTVDYSLLQLVTVGDNLLTFGKNDFVFNSSFDNLSQLKQPIAFLHDFVFC